MKLCVLDFEKECDGCGECERCDLDPTKKCDNCCRCLDEGGAGEKYREVKLSDYSREVARDELFNELLFSADIKIPSIGRYLPLSARGRRKI